MEGGGDDRRRRCCRDSVRDLLDELLVPWVEEGSLSTADNCEPTRAP